MKRSCVLGKVMLVLLLWGIALLPEDACARTPASQGTGSGGGGPVDSAVAANDAGYVDMDRDGVGDRFVDEDGDGIDDRHLKRHQRRNRQWRDEDGQRGSGSQYGESGSDGQQRHGNGPGRGGR